MRLLLGMVWVDHPSPCLAAWAVASTPRLLTWALTWSARSRRTFLRTTHATLLSLLVRLLLQMFRLGMRQTCGISTSFHKSNAAC